MLRHFYAAGTPQKNPATVFRGIRGNGDGFHWVCFGSYHCLQFTGKSFCDFCWRVFHAGTNRKTLFFLCLLSELV